MYTSPVGAVAHNSMKAHRSIDPPDHYLYGFSVRLRAWRTPLLLFTLYTIYTFLVTLKS